MKKFLFLIQFVIFAFKVNAQAPVTVLFLSNDTTVNESVSSATVYVKLLTTSTATSEITLSVSALSNASSADYSLSVMTLTFAANTPANSTFPVVVNLVNDALPESAEYVILRFTNPQNATIGSISQFAFYIADNDKAVPVPSNAISLNLLSSFSNSNTSGNHSAEIVAHDHTTQRLYIANSIGGRLDVVNFVNPSAPVLLYSVPITTYGNINSVAVFNGTVAAAIENLNPQDSGKVVFFNANGVYLNQVKVGMMPDMITFNNAGTRVITANEGEPNASYTVDPAGSVSIINVSGGISALTASNVTHVNFTAYNGQEASLRAQGIRIYGPGASASQDFEPEYVAVAADDTKAWVTLQENNAIVEISLTSNTITSIRALGTKDHSLLNNGFDASNMTRGVDISNFPVKGFYLPDAIATYSVGGVNYLITANEGDARAYSGFSEEVRIGAANLDVTKFPLSSHMKNNYVLGRLNITNKSGDTDNDGDLDTLYSYGSRSFSIWNASTGVQVYDSKDDLEMITATNSYSALFNVSNSNNTKKDRSDDKGPEPEGVTIGAVGTNTYAFIAVERIGGVMVYNINNPAAPIFVTYVNNRGTSSVGPDLGSEGVIFIPQSKSPNGQHIVVAANEISSTLSIWGIAGCSTPLSSSLSVTGATANLCSATPPTLAVASGTNLSYQWSLNGTAIPGATLNSVAANVSGSYSVAISGGTNCSTGSLAQSISVNPTPTLTISGNSTVCAGYAITQSVTGASTYSWSNNLTGSGVTFTPGASAIYTVTGTSTNNCSSTVTTAVTVDPLPTVTISGNNSMCFGTQLSLNAAGAVTYTWSNQATTPSIVVTPANSNTYAVTGTGLNGCQNTSVHQVTVNPLPVLSISASALQVCAGQTVLSTVSGATTYTWMSGSNNNSIVITPVSGNSYSVSGTDANGCINNASQGFTVHTLPVLIIGSSSSVVCAGETVTLNVTGAASYSWSNGIQNSQIVINPTSSTNFSVIGYSAFNCTATAFITQTVSTCTALNEENKNKWDVKIFPNPARSGITVKFTDRTPAEVRVLNAVGQLVCSLVNCMDGQMIDLAHLNRGIYFIQITNGKEKITKKLILE